MTVSAASRSAVINTLRAAGCVFAEDEAELLLSAARSPDDLASLVSRRAAGLPLEHLLGWAEFCGLRIAVAPGVFVPRRRTELLVREAVALGGRGAVVLDLCCGSGAVAAAIAALLSGDVELHAADVDATAVNCARRNLPAGSATPPPAVYQGDLYDPLPASLQGRVQLLVVNAPYVPTDAIAGMPPEARDHEPRAALDGGEDGVDLQRLVASGAPRWLAPDGHLLIETSTVQAEATCEAFSDAGLVPRVVRSEDLDAIVVIGNLLSRGSSQEPAAAPRCR